MSALLAAATALVSAWLGRPITAGSRTYIVQDPRSSSASVAFLSRDPRGGRMTLRIPDAPIALTPAPSIVDALGVTVDPTTYNIDPATGIVRTNPANNGAAFAAYPYTVTATTGLATRDDYTTNVEPALFQAILDVGADLYQRRNPAATEETAGGGDSVRYGRAEEDLPLRAQALIAPFRRPQL